jgi:hypothetical protein
MINEEQELKANLVKSINSLKLRYNYDITEILKLLKSSDNLLPVSVFATKLPPLQAAVIYLKSKGIELGEIAELLKRNYRTIWGAHNSTKKKDIKIEETEFYIPCSIFNNKHSILESVVYFLKENHSLRFNRIAKLLKKDQRTIWTVYNRAKKKNEK